MYYHIYSNYLYVTFYYFFYGNTNAISINVRSLVVSTNSLLILNYRCFHTDQSYTGMVDLFSQSISYAIAVRIPLPNAIATLLSLLRHSSSENLRSPVL